MSQETLKMSERERRRAEVMRRHLRGEILLKEAAWEMNVSDRHARRIKKRFRQKGDEGLVHRGRDMPSNNGHSAEFRKKIINLYKDKYPDFGPTLACEKMMELNVIKVAKETLRRWLIAESLWRVGEKERVHRRKRKRRERFGDMLQIDGSDHAWLEDRGQKATLMVMIDDATGRIMLHMAREETTDAAMALLEKWVRKHGVPDSIYADRRMVYFTEDYVHDKTRRKDPAVFTRFMHTTDRLGIDMIPAYSAQAKGRVERANRTLQDRLVKELRLLGINTIEAANAMLDSYAEKHNGEFALAPLRPANAHRTAPKGRRQREYCFCYEETRKVQKDNTVVLKNEYWQILKQKNGPRPGDTVVQRSPLSGAEPYWVFGDQRLKTKSLGCERPKAA